MDYRSTEAKYINHLFMRGELAAQDVGEGIFAYRHRTKPMFYAKTNHDRLVRVDGDGPDATFNILSADKTRFQPVAADLFIFGEQISLRGPFKMEDIVPAQTGLEYVRDVVAPKVLIVGATMFLGNVIGAGLRSFLHIPHIASSVAGNTAAAAAASGARTGAGVTVGQAIDAAHHFDAGADGDGPVSSVRAHTSQWLPAPQLHAVDHADADFLSSDHDSHPAHEAVNDAPQAHLAPLSSTFGEVDDWGRLPDEWGVYPDSRHLLDRAEDLHEATDTTVALTPLQEVGAGVVSVGAVAGTFYVAGKVMNRRDNNRLARDEQPQ